MISTLHPLSSLFFFFLKKIFIYLTALGLSCRMWDLSLLHAGISFLTRYWTWAPALGAQSLRHWTTREVPLQPLLMPSLFALSTSQPLVCITSCFHDLCLLSFAMNILFTSLAAVNSCASCISQPNHYFLREASPDFPRAHNTHTHTHTHRVLLMKSGCVMWPPEPFQIRISILCLFGNIWFLKDFLVVSKPGWSSKWWGEPSVVCFLVIPHSMWDLSSPTRNWTHALCSGSS